MLFFFALFCKSIDLLVLKYRLVGIGFFQKCGIVDIEGGNTPNLDRKNARVQACAYVAHAQNGKGFW